MALGGKLPRVFVCTHLLRPLVPAKAGTQALFYTCPLDSRFRGNERSKVERVAEMQRGERDCYQRLHFVVFDIAVRASAQALAITISHFCAGLRFRTRIQKRARKKIGEVKK